MTFFVNIGAVPYIRWFMKKYLWILLFLTVISSCDVLRNVKEMMTFAKCEFRLKSVDHTRLAGVNIQDMGSYADLSLNDALVITHAFTNGHLPLAFTLNVEVRNPNTTAASMTKVDWILLIDNHEMVNGTSAQAITIAPNGGVTVWPLQVSIDLVKALSGETFDSLKNFAFNLAGVGNKPTRITLKAKPTIMVGNSPVAYPGYITINTDFTSG
jgi:hypothetical protein